MGHKKLDMTEWLIHKRTHTYTPINTYVQIYIHIWMFQFTGKKSVSFCAVPCQGICMWLLLMGKSFSSDEASGTLPPRTKQSPFLGTLLASPKQTFFHAGSCESLLWTRLCPFLDLSKIEGPLSRLPIGAWTWRLLSRHVSICLNVSFRVNPHLFSKN